MTNDRSVPRRASGGPRRLVAIGLAAIALAAIAIPGPSDDAAVAATGDPNVFGLGGDYGGPVSGTYGPNAVIRFSGKAAYVTDCAEGVDDFVYPATDVFVVESGFVPAEGATLEDAATESPTTIVQAAGGSPFLDEILAITAPGGRLGAGTFGVVYDVCQDGTFDRHDSFFPEALHVVLPADLPPISADIVRLKSAAWSEQQQWSRAQAMFERIVGAQDYVASSACFVGDAEACWSLLQMVASDVGLADHLKIMDALLAADKCRADRSECWGLLNKLAGSPSVIRSPRDIVFGGFKNLLANQTKVYLSVYNDPPRADFDEPTVVSVDWIDDLGGQASPFADSVAALVPVLQRELAHNVALLEALEKYQGAQAAGDAPAALARAEEALGLAILLQDEVTETADALADVVPALEATVPDFDAAIDEIEEHQRMLWRNGFSEEQRRELRNLGLDDAAIDARLAEAKEQNPSLWWQFSMATVRTEVDDLVGQRAATADVLAETVDRLSVLTEAIRAAEPTSSGRVVDVVLPPVAATTGEPVDLVATVPDGVTTTWDLDADGRFDDGEGPTVSATFQLPGVRPVAVRIDGAGLTPRTAHGTIDVVDPTVRPRVVSAAPDGSGRRIVVGETFDLAVTVEGVGPVEVQWLLDDEPVAGGPSWSFTPANDQLGSRLVEAVVDDGIPGHQVRRAWTVIVEAVDADGDGWAATAVADCDDANAAVHPGAFELLLNGLDDDCDPATVDAPPSVSGGSVMAWGLWYSQLTHNLPQPRPELGEAVQVDTSTGALLARTPDGRVLALGPGCYELANGLDGCVGNHVPRPVVGIDTAELTGVIDVELGQQGSFGHAMRADGTIVGWGQNLSGQIGSGTAEQLVRRPEVVRRKSDGEPLTDIVDIDAAQTQVFAVEPDGDVWSWGNQFCRGTGQLVPGGYGRYVTEFRAVPAPELGRVAEINGGYGYVVLRRPDGTVEMCGDNLSVTPGSIQTKLPYPVPGFGDGQPLGRAVQVLTVGSSFWARTEDGSVYGWGVDANGVFSVFDDMEPSPYDPASALPYLKIRTPARAPLPDGPPVVRLVGDGETLHVVRADGSVVIWGGSTHGADGTTSPNGSRVPPTLLDLGGRVISSSGHVWGGAAVVVPWDIEGYDPPEQWLSLRVGPDDGGLTGDEGATVDVPVRLSAPARDDVVATWSTDAGATGSVVVRAGEAGATVPIVLPADGRDGPDGWLTFTVTEVSDGVGIERSSATIAVRDVDRPPAIEVDDAWVVEGDTTLTDLVTTVRLDTPSGVDVALRLKTAGGTATAGSDYVALDTVVIVPAGATTVDVHLAILGDRETETAETIVLTATGPEHADSEATATLTIRDDEPAMVRPSATFRTIEGGVASLGIEVTGLPAGESVHLVWEADGVTADVATDLLASSGALTVTSQGFITIATVDDEEAEPDEMFRVRATTATSSDDRPVIWALDPLVYMIDDDGDSTPPDVVGTPDRNPDANGWYRAPVTVTWTATDDSRPIAPPPATLLGEGADQHARSDEVCDPAGNCSVGTWGPASVDLTPPQVGIEGVRDGAVIAAHEVPIITCSADDALSGLNGPCSVVSASAGRTVEVRARAVDLAGNEAEATLSYTVADDVEPLPWSGFLQPIENTAHDVSDAPDVSVFRAGSAIPVKFRLVDSGGDPVQPGAAPRWITPVAGNPVDLPVDSLSSDATADVASEFRWTGDHWEYIWKTDRQQAGSYWRIGVALGDGTVHTVVIALS